MGWSYCPVHIVITSSPFYYFLSDPKLGYALPWIRRENYNVFPAARHFFKSRNMYLTRRHYDNYYPPPRGTCMVARIWEGWLIQ